jgi:alkylation response protein AidB-like acyl-CoA dehydrogenase
MLTWPCAGDQDRGPARALRGVDRVTQTITAAGAAGATVQRGHPVDRAAVARALAPEFAARAAQYDAGDAFGAENCAALKAQRAFGAGVPLELGGGGATHAELCELLRELAHGCASTALALAMHTHLVAATVWRLRQEQPVEPLLRRIAAEQLVPVSTGASDWLESGGEAVAVEGGFRVTARKPFSSGAPAGDLLMTTAPYDEPVAGPTVLHFPVPFDAPG